MRKMGVRLSTGVLAGTVTAKEQEIFGGMAMTMLDGMQMTTHQCYENTGMHRRYLCTGVRWSTKRVVRLSTGVLVGMAMTKEQRMIV